MPNLNKVFMMGHLTANAEIAASGTTRPYMMFTLAINEDYASRDGTPHKRVDFIDCFKFGEGVANLAPHLTKGLAIMVEGKLRKDSYERDGRPYYVTRVEAARIEFLTPKPKNDAPPPVDNQAPPPPQEAPQQEARYAGPPARPPTGAIAPDEDIPF